MSSEKKQSRPRIRLGSTNTVDIETVSTDSGLQHWKLRVFPGQTLTPIDNQQYCAGIEPTISQCYIPKFIAAKQFGVIVGIVCGHLTTPFMYRIKGLHIVEPFDPDIVGRTLLDNVYKTASNLGAKSVWCLPSYDFEREFLLANGFKETDTARDGRVYLLRML